MYNYTNYFNLLMSFEYITNCNGLLSENFVCSVSVLFAYSSLHYSWTNLPSQSSHVKCIERERQALLNFKHGLIDDYGMLSLWRDDENNRDCCRWKGIQCNNETGHVKVLGLHGSYTHHLSGAINLTSLIDLQNMEYLDLSYNYDISGSKIPKQMGYLKHLRYLNLSYVGFAGGIPYELGNLSKLEYLDLSINYIHGEIPSQLGKLTSLRYLDLNFNYNIHGEIPYQFRNLSQLQYLDLGGTELSGAIPFQAVNLPILHTLRLDGNFDLEISDAKWLSTLSSLTTLHLDSFPNLGSSHYWQQMISELIPNLRDLTLVGCNLTDKSFLLPSASIQNSSSSLLTLDLSSNLLQSSSIFHWLLNFTTDLHSLYLLDNLLEGPIPEGFGKVMTSLQNLMLLSNELQGKIPASLGNICTLKKLYLQNNNFSGEISSFIEKFSRCSRHVQIGMLPNHLSLTPLRILDLSNNQLTGGIPKSIGLLYELEYLFLEGNHLEGDINELHLTNLSKLKELDLSDNSLSLKFASTWIPSFQLLSLGLASCKLGPSFPSWLYTQSDLRFLDISDAGIDDFVPEWFWNKLQSISEMNISYNSLKGTTPNLPFKLASNYTFIILKSNQLEGGIPALLSQVYILDISENKISDLNTFLCEKNATTKMFTLDLSNNQITGQLPDCWEHLSSLEFVDLSNNKLSGMIPQSMGTLVNLKALILRNNSLIGDLPLPLKNCTGLVILDVSENFLFGSIPSWIGESLQQLKILSLRINRFFGSVPVHICRLRQIQVLDLSRNNLSGGIPTCLKNFTAMMKRSLTPREIVRKRKISSQVTSDDIYDSSVLLTWKGQEYMFLNPEYLLKSIDLSCNDLMGEIPKEVGYLLGLVSLNLSRNNLNGEIPSEIGTLNLLEFLDLSRNHFSGKIPSTLSKIDRLAVLDLSNNNLVGRIPWGRQLQTFDASSFERNPGLCGQQLNKSCSGDERKTKPQGAVIHSEDDNSVFYEALYMSLGIGFFTGFCGLIGSILLWQPWRNTYQSFLNRLTNYLFVLVEVDLARCHRWLKS